MKRTICIAMALALMAALFVGCGCQNVSERVDGMITDATEMLPHVTTDPTHGATRPSTDTMPGTETTRPTDNTAETNDPKPTTDFSRAPENVNGGTTYWMDPKDASGGSTDGSADNSTGSTEGNDMARGRGRMDGKN